MIIKEVEVKLIEPYSNFNAQSVVRRAMRYDSEIFIECGTSKINAKSLMGVISMALKHGQKLMLIVKGDDQDEAVADMKNLFEGGFGRES